MATVTAYLIASIVVELIFFVIGLIVPVGTLIILFIELVDIILLVLSFSGMMPPKQFKGQSQKRLPTPSMTLTSMPKIWRMKTV